MFSVGWFEKTKVVSRDEAIRAIGEKAMESERCYKKTLEELLEQKSENKILKDKYDTAIFDLAKCRNIQSIKISLLKRVKVLFTGKY